MLPKYAAPKREQDLMHRTNNCTSLLAFHWLTRPNYGKAWLEDRSPADPSRYIRSVIRNGMVKAQRSSHTTKEAAVSTKAVPTNDPSSERAS